MSRTRSHLTKVRDRTFSCSDCLNLRLGSSAPCSIGLPPSNEPEAQDAFTSLRSIQANNDVTFGNLDAVQLIRTITSDCLHHIRFSIILKSDIIYSLASCVDASYNSADFFRLVKEATMRCASFTVRF